MIGWRGRKFQFQSINKHRIILLSGVQCFMYYPVYYEGRRRDMKFFSNFYSQGNIFPWRNSQIGQDVCFHHKYKLSGDKNINGGETQNRTGDTRLFRPLLYRLSYLATLTGINFYTVLFVKTIVSVTLLCPIYSFWKLDINFTIRNINSAI